MMNTKFKKLLSCALSAALAMSSFIVQPVSAAPAADTGEGGRFSGMTLTEIINSVGDDAFYQTYPIWHGTACYLVDGSDFKGHFIEETAQATYVTIADGTSLPVAEINSRLGSGEQSDTILYEQDGVYWYGSNGEADHEKAVSVLSEYENVLSVDTKYSVMVKDASSGGSYVNVDYIYVDSEIDTESFIADYPELQLSVSEYSPSAPAVVHLHTFSVGADIGLVNTEEIYNGLKRLMNSGIDYLLDCVVTADIAPSTVVFENIYTRSGDTPSAADTAAYPLEGTWSADIQMLDPQTNEPAAGVEMYVEDADTGEFIAEWTSTAEPYHLDGLEYSFSDPTDPVSTKSYIIYFSNIPDSFLENNANAADTDMCAVFWLSKEQLDNGETENVPCSFGFDKNGAFWENDYAVFDPQDFYVVVGTYRGGSTLLRRFYYKNGSYTAGKIVWQNAPEGLEYGDVLSPDGEVTLTKVYSAPNDPAYAFATHYEVADDAKLVKVGTCEELMTVKELTETETVYDTSAYYTVKFTDENGTEYKYSLNTYGSSFGINPIFNAGTVYSFAFLGGKMIVPLAVLSEPEPATETTVLAEETTTTTVTGETETLTLTTTSTSTSATTATTTAAYTRSTPYASFHFNDTTLTIAAGEEKEFEYSFFMAADFEFNFDTPYLTVVSDEPKYSGTRVLTLKCAEDAPEGDVHIDAAYRHSLITSETYEREYTITITPADTPGTETGQSYQTKEEFIKLLTSDSSGNSILDDSVKVDAIFGSGANNDTDHLIIYGLASVSDIDPLIEKLTRNSPYNWSSAIEPETYSGMIFYLPSGEVESDNDIDLIVLADNVIPGFLGRSFASYQNEVGFDALPYVKLVGDIDRNGMIDAADASLILTANAESAESAALTGEAVYSDEVMADFDLYDVNSDGMIDGVDASLILAQNAENA